MKNVYGLLICDLMLDLIIVVYLQFVIMLLEFQKVLSQILWMWAQYIFTAVEIQGVPGGMCQTSGECSLC